VDFSLGPRLLSLKDSTAGTRHFNGLISRRILRSDTGLAGSFANERESSLTWLHSLDHDVGEVVGRHGVTVVFTVGLGTCAAQAPPVEIPTARFTAARCLALARKHVEDYFEKFSDLTCKETVTQIVLNNSGHALYRENSAYDYQFESTSANGSWKFNETA